MTYIKQTKACKRCQSPVYQPEKTGDVRDFCNDRARPDRVQGASNRWTPTFDHIEQVGDGTIGNIPKQFEKN